MLFIILIFFLILAFRGFASLRNHFWPFTEVQNGNRREVTSKCGNFFKSKETKGREDSIWFPGSESSLRSLRLLAKAFGVAFCYKDCFGEPHLRLRSAMARRLDDCRGSRVGCFREIAGGTPATTALLWHEEATYTRRKDFKLSSSSISCRDVFVGQASASTRPTHDFVFQSVAQR